MKKKSYDENIKILLIGESGVGKSSLLSRYVDDKFSSNFVATLGVEFKQKMQLINEKKTLIQIWDTAGQERFRTITPVYYRKVDGVVLVFDICDRESFESIDFWMDNLAQNCDQSTRKILVGNKSDMNEKRVITKEEGEKAALKHKIAYFECSAKARTNVSTMFGTLAKDILESKKNNSTIDPTQINIPLSSGRDKNEEKGENPEVNKKKGCCS